LLKNNISTNVLKAFTMY